MSRTARRLGLAAVGVGFAALAAFATAGPAAADNGPHTMLSGSAVSTADGCAGCHRMHYAQTGGDELFKFNAEGNAFCETCHGATGSGATTDVINGVSKLAEASTVLNTSDTATMNTRVGTYLNVGLRAGGFSNTRMGVSDARQGNLYWGTRSSWSVNYFAGSGAFVSNSKNYTFDGIHPDAYGQSNWGNLIPVVDTSTTKSAHQLETIATVWGSNDSLGTTGFGTSTVGTSTSLECVSCHNPHGNGNYRILRPYGFEGTASTSPVFTAGKDIFAERNTASAWSAAAKDPYNSTNDTSGMKAAITFTTDTPTFVSGQAVVVYDAAGTKMTSGTVETVTANGLNSTIVVANAGETTTASGTGTRYLRPNYASTIVKAAIGAVNPGDATQTLVTYTTASAHGLFAGGTITVNAASFNKLAVKSAKIESVLSTTTFTVYVGNAGGLTAATPAEGLFIDGIPDAMVVTDNINRGTSADDPGIPVGAAGRGNGKVYTTANYFIADDLYFGGNYAQPYQANTNASAGTGSPAISGLRMANRLNGGNPVGSFSPYIANVSQWCASCHTHYLSSNRKLEDASDSGYKTAYKHRSDYADNPRPNCIQCHVAHGSSAAASGAKSSTLTWPDGLQHASTAFPAGSTLEGSALLRVDNRGVCLMCHNPYGIA